MNKFIQDAEATLRQLQGSLGEVLDAIHEHDGRAFSLARQLHIDKKLAWRIVKVVQSTDPFAATQYVPGAAAFKMFLSAAQGVGAPVSAIESALDAFSGFETLVRVHAGDRTSLEMMLTACAKTDRRTVDLVHRRMAYRGNSFIWGVQVRTYIKCGIVQPCNHDPNKLDLVSVHAFKSLRKLCDSGRLTIARMMSSEYDTEGRRIFTYEAVSPSSHSCNGLFLLESFCTHPIPSIEMLESDRGFLNYELSGSGVGDTAAIDFVEAYAVRGLAARYRDMHNHYGENCANICIPTESVIIDMLIREDTFGEINFESIVYGENLRRTFYPSPNRVRDQLDICEPTSYLGRGTSVLHVPRVPKYPKLVGHVLNELGWDAGRFDVYRCVLDYPVVPSTIVLRHELPEAPHRQ